MVFEAPVIVIVEVPFVNVVPDPLVSQLPEAVHEPLVSVIVPLVADVIVTLDTDTVDAFAVRAPPVEMASVPFPESAWLAVASVPEIVVELLTSIAVDIVTEPVMVRL